MKTRVAAAMLTLVTLATLVVASGCGKQSITSPSSLQLGTGKPSGGGGTDSVPSPPPPPPPPPTTPAVQFLGSDSTLAGTTGTLRWGIGNASNATFTVNWTLTCELPWPDFPRSGSLSVPAGSVLPLSTPVSVPANALEGMVAFRMEVTRPDSASPGYADGWMRVYSNMPPPPPPPPPPPAPVISLGSDSTQAGGTIRQYWRVTNESSAPFTMQWTLSSPMGWPGFPQSGSLTLAGSESRDLTTTGSVPDTVTSGPRLTQLRVTRPNGLPDESTNGWFQVLP